MFAALLPIVGLIQAFLVKNTHGAQVYSLEQWSLQNGEAGGGGAKQGQGGSITSPEVVNQDQSLTICNAYSFPKNSAKGLDVFALRTKQMLTEAGAIAYKQCRDFDLPIQDGEQLDFRAGNTTVGIFKADGLPRSRAGLLVIPHRRSRGSLSASFASHAFSELGTSQLVVVDAYRGMDRGKVNIVDEGEKRSAESGSVALHRHTEDLKLNSVVAVRPGHYQVNLQDASDRNLASIELQVSRDRSKYVVVRTGIDSDGKKGNETMEGASQDLIVHEQKSQSRASSLAQPGIFAALAVALIGLRAVS